MKIVLALAYSTLFVGAAAADDPGRTKFAGAWEGNGTVWTIEDKGATLHLTRSENSKVVAEFDCNTAGKDCQAKDSGHKVTVSMYFNGPALVQIVTNGDDVIKRRFAVAGAGDTLELQTNPLAPPGATPSSAQFKRVAR